MRPSNLESLDELLGLIGAELLVHDELRRGRPLVVGQVLQVRQARSAVVLVVKVLELLVGEPRIVQERAAGRGPRLPQGLLARFDAGLVEDVVGEKAGAHELGQDGRELVPHPRAVAEAEEGHLVVLLEEALRVGVEVLGRRTEGRERGVGVLLGAGLGRSLVSARELARTARARARVETRLASGVRRGRDALDHARVVPVVAGEDEPAAAVAEAPGLAASGRDVGLVAHGSDRADPPPGGGGRRLSLGPARGRGRYRDARGERAGDARHGVLTSGDVTRADDLVRFARHGRERCVAGVPGRNLFPVVDNPGGGRDSKKRG